MTTDQTLFDDILYVNLSADGGTDRGGGEPVDGAREAGGAPDVKSLRTYAEIKSADTTDKGKRFRAIANSGLEDRDGESIDPMGWRVPAGGLPLLYGHNYGQGGQLPIGQIDRVRRSKTDGLLIEAEMADTTGYPLAVWAAAMVPRFLNKLSVGFRPLEWVEPDGKKVTLDDGATYGPRKGRRYTKQELLEVSLVPVPADPNAAVLGLRSLKMPDGRALVDVMAGVEQAASPGPADGVRYVEPEDGRGDALAALKETWPEAWELVQRVMVEKVTVERALSALERSWVQRFGELPGVVVGRGPAGPAGD